MDDSELISIVNIIKSQFDKLGRSSILLDLVNNHKYMINISHYNRLYSIIEKARNLSSEKIVSLFLDLFKTSEQEVIVDTIESNILDFNYNNILLHLINKIKLIFIKPKSVFILWHDLNQKLKLRPLPFENIITTISKLNDTTEEVKTVSVTEGVEILKVNFFDIMKDVNKLRHMESSIEIFNNFNRIVGIPKGTSPLLNYSLVLKIDDNKFYFNIFDNIRIRNIYIDNEKVKISSISKYISRYIDDICHIDNNLRSYFNAFSSLEDLRIHIPRLFQCKSINYNKLILQDTIDIPSIKEIKVSTPLYCIHEKELLDLKNISETYYARYNEFVNKYVEYDNNNPICKICGMYISMFIRMESVYFKRHGVLLITITRENPFNFPPYNEYSDSRPFFNTVINSFDSIYKTSNIERSNNIIRLMIDWMILLSKTNSDLQTKYMDLIQKTDLFFLKMRENIFKVNFDIKEKYDEKKILNLYVIMGLILILTSSFGEIIPLIKKYKPRSFDDFILKIIKNFISSGLRLKSKNLDIIVDTYISLFTLELKRIYETFNEKWIINVRRIDREIVSIDLELLPIDINPIKIISLPPNTSPLLRSLEYIGDDTIDVPNYISSVSYLYISDIMPKNTLIDIEELPLKLINDIKSFNIEYRFSDIPIDPNEISFLDENIEYNSKVYPDIIRDPFSIIMNEISKGYLFFFDSFYIPSKKVPTMILDNNLLNKLNIYFVENFDKIVLIDSIDIVVNINYIFLMIFNVKYGNNRRNKSKQSKRDSKAS